FQAAKLEQLEKVRTEALAAVRQEGEARAKALAEDRLSKMTQFETENQAQRSALESEWKNAVQPLCQALEQAKTAAAATFPPWELPLWDQWNPPREFKNRAKFGQLERDVDKLAEVPPGTRTLPLPCPSVLSVPLSLAYPRAGSILFETGKSGGDEAVTAINNIIFRLLS